MYVYKCNLCKRIFKSSIPLKSLKCSLCGGNLTFLENKLEAKKEGGSKESCKLLVDLAKFGFTMWGTAGAANTLGKVIGRGKIDKKIIIKTFTATKNAIDKVKTAGGNVIIIGKGEA